MISAISILIRGTLRAFSHANGEITLLSGFPPTALSRRLFPPRDRMRVRVTRRAA